MMILLSTSSSAGSGDNATLQDDSIFGFASSPSVASAGIRLHSDGTVDYRDTGFYMNAYTWLTGTGANSDYEALWTSTDGAPDSGTVGSWLVLSTSREWIKSGNGTCTGTVKIRMAAVPNTVLATATVTLFAETE